jgi:uncharacterized protein (DUF1800 family)
MENKTVALMAHLMRRAGFGATYEELEARTTRGYEDTVEELLDPNGHGIPPVDTHLFYRYHPLVEAEASTEKSALTFMYYLITTRRPLEEKMTLFWHMIFATGNSKVENSREMVRQIDTFRRYGMGNYKDLLVRLSKDPAMIFWLDNNQNHKKAPNENWGRELLELFSMGQGNYTEDDVKMAARAFTGWTIKPKLPKDPYLCLDTWEFLYRPEDHDDGEKEFLGHRGRFNGEDIISIVLEQPATAKFIARHLYNFFVADEVQVPSWKDEPPRDPKAVQAIADVFVKNDFEIKPTLRFLFNSDFFKDEKVWFAKIKSPAEVVAGTVRLTGEFQQFKPGLMPLALESDYQGQNLTDPPSVEGWHTGQEWITTGSLIRRVNFIADKLGDTQMPGIRSIIDRLCTGSSLSPEELVDGCLELLGAIRVDEGTRRELVEHVKLGGPVNRGTSKQEVEAFSQRVTEILQLIAATREYQRC